MNDDTTVELDELPTYDGEVEVSVNRLCYPSILDNEGLVCSRTFMPRRNEIRVSVDDGRCRTPKDTFDRSSFSDLAGVAVVSVYACATAGLPVLAEPLPENDAHAGIDFSSKASNSAKKSAAKRIRKSANYLDAEALRST